MGSQHVFKNYAENHKSLKKDSSINQGVLGFKIGHIIHFPLTIPALAMASALVVSLLLPTLVFRSADEFNVNSFKTLSSSEIPSVERNVVRIIFSDDTQKTDINNLVSSVNGHITNGPNEQGEYSIAINSELNAKNVQGVLDALKKNAHVLFAEPSYAALTSDN